MHAPLGRPSCWSSVASVSLSTLYLAELVRMNEMAAIDALMSDSSQFALDTSFATLAYCFRPRANPRVRPHSVSPRPRPVCVHCASSFARPYVNAPAEHLVQHLHDQQLHPHGRLLHIFSRGSSTNNACVSVLSAHMRARTAERVLGASRKRTILDMMFISARTQSGQSRSPQNLNFCRADSAGKRRPREKRTREGACVGEREREGERGALSLLQRARSSRADRPLTIFVDFPEQKHVLGFVRPGICPYIWSPVCLSLPRPALALLASPEPLPCALIE